jgi:hypothetical protein
VIGERGGGRIDGPGRERALHGDRAHVRGDPWVDRRLSREPGAKLGVAAQGRRLAGAGLGRGHELPGEQRAGGGEDARGHVVAEQAANERFGDAGRGTAKKREGRTQSGRELERQAGREDVELAGGQVEHVAETPKRLRLGAGGEASLDAMELQGERLERPRRGVEC